MTKSSEGKGIKIAKLHLGEQRWEYGSPIPINEWSIEDELRGWDSHHSCIDEKVLVEMLEKIEDKINVIIKKVNNKL